MGSNRREHRESVRKEKRHEALCGVLAYDEIFSLPSLLRASRECSSGVLWKGYVQQFKFNRIGRCQKLMERMADPFSYSPRRCEPFLINERGHTREITPTMFDDRVIQRALCQSSLCPLLEYGLVADNSASQKGKGTDYARKRFWQKFRWACQEYGEDGCVGLYDFSGYFDSIPVEPAMAGVSELYISLAANEQEQENAHKLIALTNAFVTQYDHLTLGNQTSQAIAIWYPNGIDHWLAEVKQFKSGRYMDDGYFFAPNMDMARETLLELDERASALGLTVNTKKTRIEKLDHATMFLKRGNKYDFASEKFTTWVSPKTMRRFLGHYKNLAAKVAKGELEQEVLEAAVISFDGVLKSGGSPEDKERIVRSVVDINQHFFAG